MVTRWGMSEVGLASYDSDEMQPFLGYELTQGRTYSEQTAAKIDGMVQQLLCERHEEVKHLLSTHRPRLDALASALLAHETVLQPKLLEILGERPTA